MDSSDDEAYSILPPNTGNTVKKEFVILEAKCCSVPRGSAWKELENKGRVRQIGVNKAWTEDMLFDQLLAALPCLNGALKNQLRVYRSTNRGSSFEKIADGVPSGKQLLEGCKGSKSKRVFIFVKPTQALKKRVPNEKGSPFKPKSPRSSPISCTHSNRKRNSTAVDDDMDFDMDDDDDDDDDQFVYEFSSDESTSKVVAVDSKMNAKKKKRNKKALSSVFDDFDMNDEDQDGDDGGDLIPMISAVSMGASTSFTTSSRLPESSSNKRTYHGDGLVVGELKEDEQLFSIVEETAGTQQLLKSEGVNLILLPNMYSVDGACQQALYLGRPIIFVIGTPSDGDVITFLRTLSNLAYTIEVENFPILVIQRNT